jgi:hypothetical protein
MELKRRDASSCTAPLKGSRVSLNAARIDDLGAVSVWNAYREFNKRYPSPVQREASLPNHRFAPEAPLTDDSKRISRDIYSACHPRRQVRSTIDPLCAHKVLRRDPGAAGSGLRHTSCAAGPIDRDVNRGVSEADDYQSFWLSLPPLRFVEKTSFQRD